MNLWPSIYKFYHKFLIGFKNGLILGLETDWSILEYENYFI